MGNLNVNNTSNNYYANSVEQTHRAEKEEEINIFPNEEIKEEILDVFLQGIASGLFGDGDFTRDEAKIYVAGEVEIAKRIEETQDNRNILEKILDPDKVEREIREQYAKENPEYAKVMEEGQRVQSEHDKAKEEAVANWEKENPAPKEVLTQGGPFGITMTEEYQEWLYNKKIFTNNFEAEYTQNNPDYENLKSEQIKYKSIFEILLGA